MDELDDEQEPNQNGNPKGASKTNDDEEEEEEEEEEAEEEAEEEEEDAEEEEEEPVVQPPPPPQLPPTPPLPQRTRQSSKSTEISHVRLVEPRELAEKAEAVPLSLVSFRDNQHLKRRQGNKRRRQRGGLREVQRLFEVRPCCFCCSLLPCPNDSTAHPPDGA